MEIKYDFSKKKKKLDKFLNYKILSHWNNKTQDVESGGRGESSSVISFHKTENIKNI